MKNLTTQEKTFYEAELIGCKEPEKIFELPKVPPEIGGSKKRDIMQSMVLAREYLKDHNLAHACLRLEIPIEMGKKIYKTGVFQRCLQKCIQILSPEEIITAEQILNGYKSIALDTFAKPNERLSALDRLNKFVVGMKPKDGLDEDGKNIKNAVPIINITLATANNHEAGIKPALSTEPSISISGD